MPGGRLTERDRERIAGGLAAGLRYAEIARELDRPTSTVSREVLRNGGPDGYRADHAQQATGDRARRGKPARGAPPVTAPDAYGRDPGAVHDFGERFVAMMAATGMPRMHARVLVALLLTDSGGLTAAELVHRLRVSPASVSKAVGYLGDLGIVSRERDHTHRRERYRILDDVWFQASAREVYVCRLWEGTAREGAELLGDDTPAGRRLDLMSRFFGFIGRDMAAAAQHWRDVLRTEAGQDGSDAPDASVASSAT